MIDPRTQLGFHAALLFVCLSSLIFFDALGRPSFHPPERSAGSPVESHTFGFGNRL